MAIEKLTETPPLRVDADGTIRVGQSRVLLELIIRAFQDGATAEEIVQRYSTTTLADIYAVIAYYLRHPGVVDKYLNEGEQVAAVVRSSIEARQGDLSGIRERLLARRSN